MRNLSSIMCGLFVAAVIILFPHIAQAGSGGVMLTTVIDQCESGSMAACHDVAEFYYGDERKRYLSEAFNFYKKACDAGWGKSCRMIGKMYYEGDLGDGEDVTLAFELFEMACAKDDAVGCFLVATMLRDGQGAAADPERSVGYFRQACEKGSAGGCDEWGMLHFSETGDETVNAEALAAFEKGCLLKNGDACFHAGRLHYKGLGTPVDHAKALDRYTSACSFGKKDACEKASQMYAQGDGTEKNEEKAFLYARGMQDQSVVAPPSESKKKLNLLPPVKIYKKAFSANPLPLLLGPLLSDMVFMLEMDFDFALTDIVGLTVAPSLFASTGQYGIQLGLGAHLSFTKDYLKGWYCEPYMLVGLIMVASHIQQPILGGGIIFGYNAIFDNGFLIKSGVGVEGGMGASSLLGMVVPRLVLGLGYAW